MKLQQFQQGQFFLTIPKSIARAKCWVKGQELYIKFGPKGELIIEEVKQ